MSHKKYYNPPLEQPFFDNKETQIISDAWQTWLFGITNILPELEVMTSTVDPASVASNTTVEQTIAVVGVVPGDIILQIIKPSLEAGLSITQGRVDTADNVEIQFQNVTGSAIDAGSETYTFVVLKG